MSTANESNGSFARAFLPGLVLGLIIGGVAGAMLPELMRPRPPAPTAEQIERAHQNTDRGERQPANEIEQPAQPEGTPEEPPAAEPNEEPVEQPAAAEPGA